MLGECVYLIHYQLYNSNCIGRFASLLRTPGEIMYTIMYNVYNYVYMHDRAPLLGSIVGKSVKNSTDRTLPQRNITKEIIQNLP